jgi:hypothetical protein
MVLQVHVDVGGHYKLGLKRMNPTKVKLNGNSKRKRANEKLLPNKLEHHLLLCWGDLD